MLIFARTDICGASGPVSAVGERRWLARGREPAGQSGPGSACPDARFRGARSRRWGDPGPRSLQVQPPACLGHIPEGNADLRGLSSVHKTNGQDRLGRSSGICRGTRLAPRPIPSHPDPLPQSPGAPGHCAQGRRATRLRPQSGESQRPRHLLPAPRWPHPAAWGRGHRLGPEPRAARCTFSCPSPRQPGSSRLQCVNPSHLATAVFIQNFLEFQWPALAVFFFFLIFRRARHLAPSLGCGPEARGPRHSRASCRSPVFGVRWLPGARPSSLHTRCRL